MKIAASVFLAMISVVSPAKADWFKDRLNEAVTVATGGVYNPATGEVCAISQCINSEGKTRTKTPDELLGDVLKAVPAYNLLSEPDKENVKKAAMVGAVFVAASSVDPITGGLVITMIAGGKEQQVPVPTYVANPPKTQIKFTMKADCLFQRTPTEISAGFGENPPSDLARVGQGDTLSLTAEMCPGIGGTSVTSVTMTATSKATPVENNLRFKWVLLGKTFTGN